MEENFDSSGKRLFLIGVGISIIVLVLTSLTLVFYLKQPPVDQQAVEIKQLQTVEIESTSSASPSSSLLDVGN